MAEPTFEHGIVAAAAWIIQAHGQETIALEMLRHLGCTEAVKTTDEYDREIIEPYLQDVT